ncbi:MAG: FAD-dependent oxidoreductase [Spirochaetia bacterium]|nr:FAD-dependent oxidoreductase [Spirochaetia bacterium]
MKEHYNYLIIGADAAGNSAAGQIRRFDKNGSIAIIEKGSIISYGACGLPYFLENIIESTQKLIHFTAEEYGKRINADIFIEHEALSLNSQNQTVKIKNNENNVIEVKYDKLMIATGAKPVRLPFIDYSSERVFELKTIPDGQQIKEFIQNKKPKSVAIIGSGYIGLECAEAFKENGIETHIFEIYDLPMPKMPQKMREDIRKNMEKNNIIFHGGAKINSVASDEDKILIKTDNDELKFDFLLSSIGIKPNTDFLLESGLKLENGAVFADSKGETSVKNIYTGGDCSLVYNYLLEKPVYFPLGHTANKQGRIAGMNMGGQNADFLGITGTQLFKFFDKVYAKTGLSQEEASQNGYNAIEVSSIRTSKAGYYPNVEKVKMQLVFDKETEIIIGASLTGPLDSYGLIDTASALIYGKSKISDIAWMDFSYAPPFAPVWNALISAAGKAKE